MFIKSIGQWRDAELNGAEIMPESNRKSEMEESDPAQLAKLIELELIQKRAAWQQTKTRRQSYRTLSFLFLFLVLLGALVAFYLLFSQQSPGGLLERP